ncbi:hypothetical protein GA0115252_166520 [Streptomyces sp. DfronAA-171]|nr:hypothetical protein GA0115252_166520 [Streptomyces sp. DfronAA-171]
MAADRVGGQAEGLEHELGEGLAVEGAGHGAAYALVGEGAGLAVERELRVGGFEALAQAVAAEAALLGLLDGARLGEVGAVLPVEAVDLLGGALREGAGVDVGGDGARGVRSALRRERAAVALAGAGDARGLVLFDGGEVDAAVEHGPDPLPGGDRAQDEAVELGAVAPPAGVALQREVTAPAVLLADAEGARAHGEPGAGGVVEGLGAAHDLLGVQRREEGAPVRVRLGEGDPYLLRVRAALDLRDAVVAGVARRPVLAVGAAQGLPLGGEVVGADFAAVVPGGLGVEVVDDDLAGLGGLDLRVAQVRGGAGGAALPVEVEHRGQRGRGDARGRGVGVRLEGVEGAGEPVDGPVQGAPLGDAVPCGLVDVGRDDAPRVRAAAVAGAGGEGGHGEHACHKEHGGTQSRAAVRRHRAGTSVA